MRGAMEKYVCRGVRKACEVYAGVLGLRVREVFGSTLAWTRRKRDVWLTCDHVHNVMWCKDV